MSFYNKKAFPFFCLLSLALCGHAFAIQKHGFDFVVGVDGDFKAAIAKARTAGTSASKRFIIFFPDGEYDLTKVTGDNHGKTTFDVSYVSLIGQTRDKAIIANKTDTESIGHTATLYFPKNNEMYMQDLTIQNKSTACGANACRQVTIQQNEGDKYIYKNVRLLSGQDTYYTKKGRTYWEGGEITGTVDFICGGGDVFFEGTTLVPNRADAVITASQNPGDWGYVFNNAIIEGQFNNNYYLGRSWGRAKTVFLNTTMKAAPKASGWQDPINYVPVVFAEYNSMNGSGQPIDLSQRRSSYTDKNGGSANLNPRLSQAEAAKYTLASVIGGTDNWSPNKLTQQVEAPKISQEGANIVWDDNENAICWAVFVNGKYHANTTSHSIDVGGIDEGSKVTVRAANSMGGLGPASNEIAVQAADVTYCGIHLSGYIGGTVKITDGAPEDAQRIAEGTTITISAIPIDGWEFESWHHQDSAAAGGKPSWTTTVRNHIALQASFKSKLSVFQAETGELENATIESSNTGFEGTGYVNFGAEDSEVRIPVYVNAKGTYNMTIRYANGSGKERILGIATYANSSVDAPVLTFEATADWNTFTTKDLEVKLPAGASYIWFRVFKEDGPNIDQIELKPLHVESPQDTTKDTATTTIARGLIQPAAHASIPSREQLFTMNGQLVRQSTNAKVSTQGLKPGIYLKHSSVNGMIQEQIIQVR